MTIGWPYTAPSRLHFHAIDGRAMVGKPGATPLRAASCPNVGQSAALVASGGPDEASGDVPDGAVGGGGVVGFDEDPHAASRAMTLVTTRQRPSRTHIPRVCRGTGCRTTREWPENGDVSATSRNAAFGTLVHTADVPWT